MGYLRLPRSCVTLNPFSFICAAMSSHADSARLSPDARACIIRGWLEIGNDLSRAFDYFERHKATLLQLISVDQFLDQYRVRPASTRPSQPSNRPLA